MHLQRSRRAWQRFFRKRARGSGKVGFVRRFAGWETDDPELAEALAQIESADVNARGLIAQRLSMYPVQRAVLALTSMVMSDPEPSVRAAAVASLAIHRSRVGIRAGFTRARRRSTNRSGRRSAYDDKPSL